MPVRVASATMGDVRDLFSRGAIGAWTDGQLIGLYLSGESDSEAAFRVLIHRHGPMVLGVCRRIIGDEHAAEDAFQATFIVLVKKARTLRDRALLANWLYGVAIKISYKERKRGARRQTAERCAAESRPLPENDPEADELKSLITDEIARLPDRYRMPLWLCHIEGLPHDEAARRLGCPVGTVESRLSRGRDRLRERLVRRGLTAPAIALAVVPGRPLIGRVPAGLVESTLQATLAAPGAGAAGLIADRVMWGREVEAVAGISLGAGAAAAGLAIALGLVAFGLDRYATVGRSVRITRVKHVVAVDQPATPQLAIDDWSASTAPSAEQLRGLEVARLVDQLRRRPAPPSRSVGQVGLYLVEAKGGHATLIANEPAEGINQCGSPAWSHDGRRIVFDATAARAVGQANFQSSRLRAIELDGDILSARDLGPGNCPEFSPEDSQIVFLYNGPTTPGGDSGVYFMQADGSNRRPLGIYGRPKWSPQSQQLLIAGFSRPTIVTIMDIRPEQSEELDVPGHQIFSVPNWVSEGTIVAVIGPAGGPGDTIALVDVTAAARGKVKEVLWKRTTEADVLPYGPIYSPVSRRCVFIGKTPGKGRALYTFEPGKPAALRRLESGGSFDNLIQDPIFSPDGRFVVFSTDRKPPLGPGDDVPSSRPDAGTDPTLWSRRVGSSAKSPDTSAPPRDRPRLP